MFSAFLSQLSALLSGRNEQDTVKVVPEPVRPEVKPTPVVPEPETAPTPLPDLSSKRNGAKCDDIWGGFRQGPDGNCVTVSAINAAMHKFGQSPTDVYKRVRKTAQGYEVTMRDGYYLTVSHQELKQAAAGHGFLDETKAHSRMLSSCLLAVSSVRIWIITMAGLREVLARRYAVSIMAKMKMVPVKVFSGWA